MNRRVVVGLGVAVVVTAVAAGGRALSRATPSTDSASTAPATAVIERRDLTVAERLNGTLGFADERGIAFGFSGTVTSLPAPGAVLGAGELLGAVNEHPVALLHGAVPLWRELRPGIAAGDDVRQLEENLVALGFASASASMPDGTYNAATAAAVRKWQRALGVKQTGRIAAGDVVFASGDVRVIEHERAVGATVGPTDAVLRVTATVREVHAALPAAQSGLVAVGDRVVVVLPDDTRVPGTVHELGRGLEVGEQGGSTRAVWVRLDDSDAVAEIDTAPVEVEATRTVASNVLAVPVHALLAVADGGYSLEVINNGRRTRVKVKVGVVADGWAEVSGTVSEGDQVVVPA